VNITGLNQPVNHARAKLTGESCLFRGDHRGFSRALGTPTVCESSRLSEDQDIVSTGRYDYSSFCLHVSDVGSEGVFGNINSPSWTRLYLLILSAHALPACPLYHYESRFFYLRHRGFQFGSS
jgi:hypothetical protein